MSRLERLLGQFVTRYRWLVVLASLLIAGVIATGMGRLTFVNDSRMYFSKENPQLIALEALENTYTKDDNIIFILAPDNGKVFTKPTLAAISELTEKSWLLPYSSRVDSLTNFQHTTALDDDLIVEDMVIDLENYTDDDLERVKKIALAEPLLVKRLISSSAHVTGVVINTIKPGRSQHETQEIALAATKLKKEIEAKYPHLKLYLTGGVMIDDAFGVASKDDMSLLIPLMFGILLIVMAIALRSFSGTMATLTVIILSMITGLGMAGWLGIALTPASANAPIIIMTLAVADSIHILVSIFHHYHGKATRHECIAESLRINLQPVFVTSVTTAIGFLTMNFSDAPPFRDLGNIVAMGVLGALFYSIFFLPALMAILPIKAQQEKPHNRYEKFGKFVVRKRGPIFITMLFMIVMCVSGISKIVLDDDFIDYFDHRYDFRVASDFAADNLTGLYVIEYNLQSGESGGINNPEYQQTLEDFANWFRLQDHVNHVYSITDIMKQLNKSMHGDDQQWYRLPGNRELAAQYFLLYEMSLPFGLDLNDRINVDKSSSRLTINLVNITTKELRDLEEQGRQWLRANAPESMFTYGSGLSIVFSYISERNINSMLFASVLALVLISMIMIIVLRSFKLGLLSLLPNLMPAFMAFGLWGFVVGQVGLAVSVMIAMTLGIVVDDSVHFLSKYQRARNEHDFGAEDAVMYAFQTVGSPIMTTSIILVCGFTVLAFSGFQINSHMGSMTAITIVLALILDFFFLPTLLIKLEGQK